MASVIFLVTGILIYWLIFTGRMMAVWNAITEGMPVEWSGASGGGSRGFR